MELPPVERLCRRASLQLWAALPGLLVGETFVSVYSIFLMNEISKVMGGLFHKNAA